MAIPLRILLVEDSDDDADLLLRELQRGGYIPEWERVDTTDTLNAALTRQEWDVITCDYVMPRLSAQAALDIIRQHTVDAPVIIVSGEVGEEVAVAAMKAGAVDFVSKHKLTRLLPAIARELREAEDRRARRRAEEDRARLIAAVEQAQDSVMITAMDGSIVYVNPAFERLTGYTRAEVYGRQPHLLRSDPNDENPPNALCATIARGEAWKGTAVQRRKDGTLYQLEVTISPVHDAEGRVTNLVGIGHNVTRERQLAAQLHYAQKMEAAGRLAAGVAHEFNNQLTVVKGSAQLLLAKLAPRDAARREAERITVAVDRSARLVHQLLTFGRQRSLDAQPLNLTDVVTEATPMLRLLLGEQLTLRVAAAPDVHAILADRSQVEQVLMHLVTTARGALTPSGQRTAGSGVWLETANATLAEVRQHVPHADGDADAHVRLTVRDDGIPLPAAAQEHIFEPFYSATELGRGTGLGLATVFGIVQQHHGYIACSSGPDHGTAFHVYWRAAPSGTASSVPDQTLPSPSRQAPVTAGTILVVEDEADVRALLVRALTQAGHRVYSASTANEALEVAARIGATLDLLVTDVVMPGDSGAVLARRLRQEWPSMPVLLISGHLADPLDLADLPGARFLPKPFGLNDLLTAVAELLARRRITDG